MPGVGDEQHDVAGVRDDLHRRSTVVGEVDIVIRSNGASWPDRWLPGTIAVGPSASVQSRSMMCAATAKTGYGIRSSQATPGGRGTCGPASVCQGPPSMVRRVPPRGVRDHVAVVAEQRLDDLEDPRVPDDGLA